MMRITDSLTVRRRILLLLLLLLILLLASYCIFLFPKIHTYPPSPPPPTHTMPKAPKAPEGVAPREINFYKGKGGRAPPAAPAGMGMRKGRECRDTGRDTTHAQPRNSCVYIIRFMYNFVSPPECSPLLFRDIGGSIY